MTSPLPPTPNIRRWSYFIFVRLILKRGGGGVDMQEYARRMTSSRCDGDHITLQALCDALQASCSELLHLNGDF